MSKKVFINLPVADLPKSKAFFTALGWRVNPQFTDDTAASLVVSEEIYVMLLTHQKFKDFTDRSIAPNSTIESIVAISVDSKDEVNQIADAALRAGGKEPKPPQDYGFMQLRSFLDPDGHH